MGLTPRRRPRDRSSYRDLPARATRHARQLAWAALPLVQLTAAATTAWVLAKQLGDHDEPFFAPIAVVVALSSPLGERGSNAVRLLVGVLVGIGAGELTIAALGGGYGQLALAMFVAMAVARALGGPRLVMVQAAAAAILTVAAADGQAGVHRLIDAGIGAAVALVFSQFLLSPEPVALVRRAAADALARMADALSLAAQALERDEDDLADEATTRLRDVRDSLAELGRLRKASTRVARHSVIWRSRIAPVVRENENTGHLDLLGVSCLMLTRTAMAVGPPDRATLAPSVHKIAEALKNIAADPGDRATRQDAVDYALDIARGLSDIEAPKASPMAAAVMAVKMVTTDVMVFAGADVDEAAAAVREGTGELRVPAPPATPRVPFVSNRRWRRRS